MLGLASHHVEHKQLLAPTLPPQHAPLMLAVPCHMPRCAVQTMDAIQSAIRESPLQLNPKAEGQEILVPIPRCGAGKG